MFLQNFVTIGWTVAEILRIFDFQYFGRPPSWIWIWHFARFAAKICLFVHNLVTIGWTVAELLQIKYFKYGGRPPSWICYTHARDHPRCRFGGPKKPWKFCPNRLNSFWDIAISAFWSFGWGVPIHAPILGVFRGYDPLRVVSYHRDPQKAPMVTKTSWIFKTCKFLHSVRFMVMIC